MAQHTPPSPVASVLEFTQAVAVLDVGSPSGQRARPRAQPVFDTDFAPQHLPAPAVVVPCQHHDTHARFSEIRERSEHAKRSPRNDVPPLEPEIEEVTVDHERPCPAAQRAKKVEHVAVYRGRPEAEMRVRKDVAGCWQHADILAQFAYLYNRT
jgi:hypothetical protein